MTKFAIFQPKGRVERQGLFNSICMEFKENSYI